ncbi:hypothetical protein C0Q70_12130 [Pomacea canaliculata]|uniref:Uncharacterized protein n=1 Tax=Pomacea canaliculata TaxID=400727 RepID=A0A2T7P0N6_POMCA|nr:hypothetical protein C0Q70_12130 [Pomacea canaliculata]
MTTVEVFLLTAFVMTTFTESKSLAQAEKKTTCGIRGLGTSDMMLTCYFHHNVNALQKDFTVYLYKGEESPSNNYQLTNYTRWLTPGADLMA